MLAQLLSVLEALVAPEGDAGPGRGTVDQPVALPAATIAKVVAAAMDKQPAQQGGAPDAVLAYLSLLRRALARLHAEDPDACAALLPRAFGPATADYFLPPGKHASDQLAVAAANLLS